MKTTIIIPTKNESRTIKKIIQGSKKYADEIIVVDSNSKDYTADMARKLGVKVVTDLGKGKGAAERFGARHAKHEILVFIDADGSYDTNDIKKLVEPIKKNKADLVLGSRMLGGSDELHSNLNQFLRLMGNTIFTLIINYRFNKRLTDCESGFRAIKKKVFFNIKTKENGFTIEQEVVIKCLKRGYKVSEVPAHEYVREHGSSNLNVLIDGFKFIGSLIKNIF